MLCNWDAWNSTQAPLYILQDWNKAMMNKHKISRYDQMRGRTNGSRGRAFGHASFACRYVGCRLLEAVDISWTDCAGAHMGVRPRVWACVFFGVICMLNGVLSKDIQCLKVKFRLTQFDPRIVSVEA